MNAVTSIGSYLWCNFVLRYFWYTGLQTLHLRYKTLLVWCTIADMGSHYSGSSVFCTSRLFDVPLQRHPSYMIACAIMNTNCPLLASAEPDSRLDTSLCFHSVYVGVRRLQIPEDARSVYVVYTGKTVVVRNH